MSPIRTTIEFDVAFWGERYNCIPLLYDALYENASRERMAFAKVKSHDDLIRGEVVEIGIKFNYWADPVFYPFGICNSRVDDEGRRTFSLKAHTKVVYHAKAVEATSDQGLGSIEVGKQIEYPPHKIIALFNGQFIENVEDARKYVASTLGDNLS